MKLAGIAGWPIGHSLSPRLHAHWLRENAIAGAYVPLAIRREAFSTVVDALRLAGFIGLNVTVPHKEAAFALAHELDDDAGATGAVNLMLFRGAGRIEGRNTDVAGLETSLREELGPDVVGGKPGLVLGAGGAARAAVMALDRLGASEIRVVSRNCNRAESLARQLQHRIAASIVVGGLGSWPDMAESAALVVNATSAGMADNPPLDLSLESLPATAAICDLVYNPAETDLLKRSRRRGLRAINGLGMLLYQAVPAFAAFYGIGPTITPTLRADLAKACSQ